MWRSAKHLETQADSSSGRAVRAVPDAFPDPQISESGAVVLSGVQSFLCGRRCAARTRCVRRGSKGQRIFANAERFSKIRCREASCFEQRSRARRARDRPTHVVLRCVLQMTHRQGTRVGSDCMRVSCGHAPLHPVTARSARHAKPIQSKQDCNEREPERYGALTGHGNSCGFLHYRDACRIAHVSATCVGSGSLVLRRSAGGRVVVFASASRYNLRFRLRSLLSFAFSSIFISHTLSLPAACNYIPNLCRYPLGETPVCRWKIFRKKTGS